MWRRYISKQSLRAVLRTLIKIYTFAPNFKFGDDSAVSVPSVAV